MYGAVFVLNRQLHSYEYGAPFINAGNINKLEIRIRSK